MSRGQVNAGDSVDIRFTVDNFGDRIEVIELEDKPVMDILMSIGTSSRVPSSTTTRWSDGREITSEMRRLELAPGESRTIEMTWIAVEGDNYEAKVVGILHGEHGDTDVRTNVCRGACGLGY